VNWRTDLFIFSGVASAAAGLWWAYPPAALVFGGLVLLVFGVLSMRLPRAAAPSAPAENPPGSEG